MDIGLLPDFCTWRQKGAIFGRRLVRAPPPHKGYKIWGKGIVRIRKRIGFLSQEELAFRAEVHRTYISQLERGVKIAHSEDDFEIV